MSDIVGRLRAPAYWFSGSSEGHEGENSAPLEAARTIEILRVELARINMENDRLTRTNRAKREHRDKLLQEIERLRAALPEGMEHCKIIFEECEMGHGRLRGDNWLKKDCPWCEIKLLRQELGDLLAIIHRDGGHHTGAVGEKQSVEDAHQVWAKLMNDNERLRAALRDVPNAIRIASKSSRYADGRMVIFTRGLYDGYEAAAQVAEHIARAALEGEVMTDTLIVDPPDGHRYGFPKAVPDNRRHDIIAWMVEQGYPRSIIDEWVEGHFPLRCWYEEPRHD